MRPLTTHPVTMTTTFNTTLSMVIGLSEAPEFSGLEEERPVYRVVMETITILAMWLVSIPMNVLVCVVIYRSRRVQSTTNYFVVSLAVSDLILSIFCVPFVASRVMVSGWKLGSIVCRLVRFFLALAHTTSVFVLVSISIDRFYTIIYPLSFKITRGTAKHLIACCWALAFTLCIFSVYFFDTTIIRNGSEKLICPTYIPNTRWTNVLYGATVVSLSFILPTMFVVIVYSRIFRYVWTTGIGNKRLRRTMNLVPRTKVKMLKMLIVVTSLTLICVVPYHTTQLWYTISSAVYVEPTIYIASFWLLYATTMIKPIVYMWFNTNFRRGCREVFCMSQMKCYRSSTYAITTASNIGKKNHVGIMPSDCMSRTLQSPTIAFNRTSISAKYSWPITNGISTTYI